MKKIIMAAMFALFSMVAFAGVSKEKFKSIKGKNKATVSKVSDCFTLKKIEVCAGYCSFSYFDVAAVITIKTWCDGTIEVFPWFQDTSLMCS